MSDDLKNIEVAELENGNGKNKHTIVDEIADNIVKILLVVFILWGFGYCMMAYVGKDKGVDPNLVYGFFAGSLSTLIPSYFAINKTKKEKPTE